MRRTALLMLTVAIMGCAARGERIVLHPDGLLRITGTFTDLHVVDQRGVFGAEVRIACTEQPSYQAVVQIGSGSLCEREQYGDEPCFRVSNLMVVEAEFDWEGSRSHEAALRFRLPVDSPYAGTFEGSISEEWLVGTLSFASGRSVPLKLRRGASHWDRDRPPVPPTGAAQQ